MLLAKQINDPFQSKSVSFNLFLKLSLSYLKTSKGSCNLKRNDNKAVVRKGRKRKKEREKEREREREKEKEKEKEERERER